MNGLLGMLGQPQERGEEITLNNKDDAKILSDGVSAACKTFLACEHPIGTREAELWLTGFVGQLSVLWRMHKYGGVNGDAIREAGNL